MALHIYPNWHQLLRAKRENPSVWSNGDTVLVDFLTARGVSFAFAYSTVADYYTNVGPGGIFRYFTSVEEWPGLVPAHPFGIGHGTITGLTRLDGWGYGEDPVVDNGWTDTSAANYSLSMTGDRFTLQDLDTAGYCQIRSSNLLTASHDNIMVVLGPFTAIVNPLGIQIYIRSWLDATNICNGWVAWTSGGMPDGEQAPYVYTNSETNSSIDTVWNSSAFHPFWIAQNSSYKCGHGGDFSGWRPTYTSGVADATVINTCIVQVGSASNATVRAYIPALGVYRITVV